MASTTRTCVFVDAFNCFLWELYDCEPSDRATICQAGNQAYNMFWIHAHTLTHRHTNVILDNGSFGKKGKALSEVDLLLLVQE